MNRIRLLARQATTVALDLLFPPYCVSCQRVGSLLCERCVKTITPAPARTVSGLDGVCVRATYEGAVRDAIHGLKYNHQARLAESLGALLSESLAQTHWPVEVVVPVPLHATRLRERGYNQAALLAAQIAQRQTWVCEPDVLGRVRETVSQVQLSAQERRENVAGAFAADSARIIGKSVLVVDDVLTTGATLSACADALRAAGAVRVYGAAVAGAVFSGDG